MAWDLRGNMEAETARAVLVASGLTVKQVDELYPAYPYERNDPIVDGGAVVDGAFDIAGDSTAAFGAAANGGISWSAAEPALSALTAAVGRLPQLMGDGGPGIGSNSWVVGGDHTASEQPLLANDPHLSPSMPGIWYQMGLHCDCAFNVAGFTFSGVPGVVIGHTDRIAWGFTNLDPDVTDLYLEKVEGDRVFDGTQWIPLTTRQETIKVAGGEPVVITVRSTKHGPLVSDRSKNLLTAAGVPPVEPSGSPRPAMSPAPESTLDPAEPGVPSAAKESPYAVALRWTALDPGRTVEALFAINQITDWDSFREAAAVSLTMVLRRPMSSGATLPSRWVTRRVGCGSAMPLAASALLRLEVWASR
jgi:penicillin amidase